MIPVRLIPAIFGLVLSCLMSLLISGVSTLRSAGPIDGFFGIWMGAWLPSWIIAFPVVLVVAPLARRIVSNLAKPTTKPAGGEKR
ncbi:DUF2798 domain-containing protein [Neorhizobium sp. T7_12]|uniref:DUF2798 domain-containing protein n=1 Tax=Neorhizobium sp. T7_12 TaxID=2093832 RepID=UPI000CFA7CA5|nr:DUF2798 domain-containing protein [Neorhizobium sp. T7_12]